MENTISFQTRARAIDHLGREQIADVPTAVSELWKNSFDAYARNAEVHLFDDDRSVDVATVVDDGHGMTVEDIIQRWLVIGTESKFDGGANDIRHDSIDRAGLKKRPKQGQKGIGRLSSAMLGPLLLLISKTKNANFVALLIDWRLFQNPYLFLEDIRIPVKEFNTKKQLFELLPSMFDQLMGNVWGDPVDKDASDKEIERNDRLEEGWDRFNKLELTQGKAEKKTTRSLITHTIIESMFQEYHLESWPVWNGSSESGTALIISDIHDDLKAQYGDNADQTVSRARSSFFATLISFTNHISKEEQVDFSYRVCVHQGQFKKDVIAPEFEFSRSDWEKMEHRVDGEIDDKGVFKGKVTAFGDDLGTIEIPLQVNMPTHPQSRVGSIRIQLGSYEAGAGSEGLGGKKSSMDPANWADIDEKLEKYCGLKVYRDGLRVMPYGKADNDFFEIEQRRSKNAGFFHYSLRNMIGAISLDGEDNKNLRDKAGREGFIENKASKAFREVVSQLLTELAKRYYGRDKKSKRHEYIPELTLSYNERKAEQDLAKTRERQKKQFNKNLNKAKPKVDTLKAEIDMLVHNFASNRLVDCDIEELLNVQSDLEKARSHLQELKVNYPPRNLTPSVEKKFRDYRDNYEYIATSLVNLNKSVRVAIEKAKPESAYELSKEKQARTLQSIDRQLRTWETQASEILASERTRIKEMVQSKREEFHIATSSVLGDVKSNNISLSKGLQLIDDIFEERYKDNEGTFEPYVSTLNSLREHIDLAGLANYTVDKASFMQEEIDRLNSLAQLGITVEIIGHELNDIQTDADNALLKVEKLIPKKEVASDLRRAFGGLVDKLKFLSPLKLSGEVLRESITGADISEYCQSFFGKKLHGIEFIATDSFKKINIFEQKSRIFPVFINLINNSLYWVKQRNQTDYTIKLDLVDQYVVVSDNGTGVYPDDIKDLFTIFFTKKTRGGRGVGLFLCRRNLAAGGHKIFYGEEDKFKVLDGANFVIGFKGLKYE